jgi:choice-of-anchor C domain-containing protein
MMTKLIKKAGLVASGAMLLLPVVASANLVTDGDFTAAGDPASFTTYGVGYEGTAMGGWTVDSGSVDLIGGYWQAPPGGGNSVDMAGYSSGTISQTINDLVVGQLYQLGFYLSGNPDGQPGTKELGVGLTIGGASPYAFSYTIGANTETAMNYAYETESFTANSTSEVLQFQDQSGYDGVTPYGAVIGGVSLTAVPQAIPEPTTIVAGALMLLPFGIGAFRSLRKERTA